MKVFEYSYYVRWGAGQGIVVAESIEEATNLLMEPHKSEHAMEAIFPQLEFNEIDLTTKQVVDMSWW